MAMRLLDEDESQATCCTSVVECQASSQAYLRPSLWIPLLRSPHKSKQRIWQVTFPKSDEHLIIIKESLLQSGLVVSSRKTTKDGFFFEAWKITEWGWLSIVTLELLVDPLNERQCTIKANAGSTGLLPVSLPGAPALNILFCWVPFPGTNDIHLDRIYRNIQSQI